ncbi:MAG: hypothetical protein AUK56_00675 [Thiomicrospira sp. CG2_30_44_34]|nr:MAG: hypothetical protein AUK56_00675 [Thiomicrospira sp. CG2_30_44_34]
MSLYEWKLQWQQWWQSLSVKDQRALWILATVLGLAVLYFAVWLPSETAKQQAQQRLQVAQTKWHWLNEQLPKLSAPAAQLPAQKLKDVNGLLQYVQAQLRQLNLYPQLDQMETRNQKLIVSFKSVESPRLFRWLSQQERQGLVATSVDIQPIKTGMVSAQLIFEVPK